MPLTLGMTGMDPATEAALKAAFEQANTDGQWRVVPEADASHVLVDMDSMYGPMSWLRLHAAGKHVIGLTSAPRTQTDFRLARPFDAVSLGELLRTVAQANGAPAPTPATKPTPTPAAPVPAAAPSGMAPAPKPQDQLPEELPQAMDEEARAPAPAPAPAASVEAGTLAATTIEPPTPPAPPPPPAPTRERRLGDWLAPQALAGRVRYGSGDQSVLIDADARHYFGPAALNPLAVLFDAVVARDDFRPVDAASWAKESAAHGAAQPLNRLQWYGGLLAGNGTLLPGFDPDARYKLSKWPQTEREFPKHFRIATAMMKGPATLDEIAAASGVPASDVADFINASLATGFAEPYREPEPEPEPQKSSGLFGRLRGK